MKILCATDLLPNSDSALERAAMLAEDQGAQLILIHVLPEAGPPHLLEQERQHAERQLRLRARPPQWRHAVVPTCEIRSGNRVQALVEAARDLKPALIVFGSNRTHFVCEALAGTIADRVWRQTDCPVLVVRRMPWRAYRRVLLLLDCVGSSEVVDAFARLVLHRRANAAIASACDSFCAGAAGEAWDSTSIEGERPLVIAEPRGCSSAPETPQLQVAMMHERATMANLIHRRDVRLSPDLLIVGAGRCGWVRRIFQRDPVSTLLATRGCDVLIVPRRRGCSAPRRMPRGPGARRWKELLRAPGPARDSLQALPFVREPTISVCKSTREVCQ